jgi:hypothetical protein
MTAKGDVHEALNEAYRAAWFFTGSIEAAENAVLDGIAASDFGHIVDDVLLVETVKSAIRRRADLTSQSKQAPSHLPWELQRLFLLAPISRDSFVLRVLLGITPEACSGILHLTTQEREEVLCAALQELPRLEDCSSNQRKITQTQGSSTIRRTTTTEKSTDAKAGSDERSLTTGGDMLLREDGD